VKPFENIPSSEVEK